MNENSKEYFAKPEDAGSVQISEEVVASIAAIAAAEIDGVSGLVSDFAADIAGMLGKKTLARGIKIMFVEDSVDITVVITVRYGYIIPDVARKVQDSVVDSVESMTGLTVGSVNVHVVGIVFDREAPAMPAEVKEPEALPAAAGTGDEE